MTVPMPASEIAVGDYSPNYGTVKAIVEHRDRKTNELKTLDIDWFNGEKHTAVEADRVYDIIGGGLTDHGPIGTVRPDLKSDHAKD